MNKLAHFIVRSKAAAYIAALLCVIAWAIHSTECGGIDAYDCLGLLLCLIMGYLSVKAGRELLFNDMKSVLPATLFFMGCAIAPRIIPQGIDGVHFILFLLACYVLLQTYRDRSAMGNYFLVFVLVGIQCLLAPPFLLTLPWLVLCGTFMESLHGRTLLAALWGLLFPYWVVLCVLFLTDRMYLVAPYLGRIFPMPFVGCGVPDSLQLWALLIWVLLLAFPGSVSIVLDRTMKIQSSAGLRLLIFSLVILLVSIGLSPDVWSALTSCVLLLASLIGSVLFVRNGTRATNICLVAMFFGWLLFFGYTLWSNFMTH